MNPTTLDYELISQPAKKFRTRFQHYEKLWRVINNCNNFRVFCCPLDIVALKTTREYRELHVY